MQIKKIIQILDEFDILFSYSGFISQEVLVELANVVKKDLSTFETKTPKVNKVYEVVIEMLHNVLNHSKDQFPIAKNQYKSKGSCLISKNENQESYSIFCINTIHTQDKQKIKEKIDFINKLTPQERKIFQKQQLQKKVALEDRGAGLGFFEISKRSTQKLEYQFFTIDTLEYFVLKATV